MQQGGYSGQYEILDDENLEGNMDNWRYQYE